MAKKWQNFVPAPRLVCVELNPGPKRGKKLREEQKWGVINLWKIEKQGSRTIAKKMGISRTSVQNLIHKYKEPGPSPTDLDKGENAS